MANKRIGLIGYRHEAMFACPILTDESTTELSRGRDVLAVNNPVVTGVMARIAEEPDFEIVPLLFGRMVPGGPIDRDFYEDIKAESLALIAENGPYDGMLVVNHGAAEVDELGRHGDTDYITAIRAALGRDVPIAVPFDHHGQVTQELLDALDAMAALRTAPHRDAHQTSYRATHQLIGIIRSGKRPKKAAVRVPIYVPGEKSMTTYSPAKELFAMLPDYDALPGVGEAHIMVGFGWNDVPWAGMTTVVTHEDDEARALELAREIADKVWARRNEFGLKMETASIRDGLSRATQLPQRVIYLADSGDNTTCGAGGDLTFVLQEALDLGLKDIVVGGIFDAEAVAACHEAGEGATVTFEIGNHISARKQPRTVTGTVVKTGSHIDASAYSNLTSSPAAWASVRIDGVLATFHAARVSITGPGHFSAMDIDPLAAKIYVVKVGYLHPAQEDIAGYNICLLSEGVGQLDLASLPYHRIPRPAFPMDADMDWSSAQGIFDGNRHVPIG